MTYTPQQTLVLPVIIPLGPGEREVDVLLDQLRGFARRRGSDPDADGQPWPEPGDWLAALPFVQSACAGAEHAW